MEMQPDPQTSSSSASYVANNGFGPPGPSAPDPAAPTCIAPCHFLKGGSLQSTALHHNCRACYDHNEVQPVESEELVTADAEMLSQSSQFDEKPQSDPKPLAKPPKGKDRDGRYYVCPFYALDSDRFYHCGTYALTSFSRVKEHIGREHYFRQEHHYCTDCCQAWSTEKDLENHKKNCQSSVINQTSILSEEQYTFIGEPGRKATDEEKWETMWAYIFPDLPLPSYYAIDPVSRVKAYMWTIFPFIFIDLMEGLGHHVSLEFATHFSITIVNQIFP
ncbi:hypothetical protein FCIRC_10211 [Fusarium circinatum]|uniref:C2H2-type domain-containing protein n=1 Tax=Fusarium circinatum TaxID=48490 RepID=A0A8H5WKR6_FUSCI|nr:hypothetical protein FCIRC_10211 [Fusarium circinatum]